ncbi:Uncharacterised protein [Segatella copri]|nr:Uncharacterised protein [Segatella copri]
MSNSIQTDITLKSRSNPAADTTLVSQFYPLVTSIDSTMK